MRKRKRLQVTETTTPPANFKFTTLAVEKDRIGPEQREEFKTEFIRLRLLTELAAIKIALAGACNLCFDLIESELKNLTREQLFEATLEAERKL